MGIKNSLAEKPPFETWPSGSVNFRYVTAQTCLNCRYSQLDIEQNYVCVKGIRGKLKPPSEKRSEEVWEDYHDLRECQRVIEVTVCDAWQKKVQ